MEEQGNHMGRKNPKTELSPHRVNVFLEHMSWHKF